MLCLLIVDNKKKNVKKKVGFLEVVKKPSEAGMMHSINGTNFLFTKNMWIEDSGALCHITNNDTIFLTSLTSMGWFKEALGTCWWWKKRNFMSTSDKLMVLNGSILYGLWSFAPRQVPAHFPWHANSCKERRSQVTMGTTLLSVLWMAISSLIAESKIIMAG